MGYYIKDISEEVICPRNRSVRYPKLQIFVKMDKLWSKRRKARLIEQLGTIYISNISEGTAFLLQGVTKNDSKS